MDQSHDPAAPRRRSVLTFLFTDIVGSTRLWEAHPEAMRSNLERHDALLRSAIVRHGGIVFKTVGDAFCASFEDPHHALVAAVEAQSALRVEPWREPAPIGVRMAVHAGPVDVRDGDYFGPPLNRVARLLAIGHGGQVLVSAAAVELAVGHLPAGAGLVDLGEHRLRDLADPERVSQLVHANLPAEFPPLRSLSRFTTNLPPQLNAFVGRERELAQIGTALGQTRLLTLIGPGGSGKTRLSLHAAAEAQELCPDGVWLVELAPIADGGLVARTVAAALGIAETDAEPVTATIARELADRRVLLVLDNCEHILAAAAELSRALLRECPQLRILASSREAMGISGERLYRVPTLTLPESASLADATACESVRLFVERARAIRPDFEATEANAGGVASICRRVDGIPLAIELAAARVRAMSVEQIDGRLRESFRLLVGGNRDALPRQQTLHALIDWSHELLSDADKVLLRRLSVFAGGWTLEAAEAVASGGGIEDFEVLDGLTSLIDKSLVVYEERGGRPRYRLLETVRHYAQGRLVESGEADGVHHRHVAHFVEMAETAGRELTGPNQAEWYAALELDTDNIRAALDRCLADPDGGELGLRICTGIQRYWYNRGHFVEGQERANAALAHPGAQARTRYRATTLGVSGILASEQGNHAYAISTLHSCVELLREFDDVLSFAIQCNFLGMAYAAAGRATEARPHFEEALEHFTAVGSVRGIGISTLNLGNMFMFAGMYAEARDHLNKSLEYLQAAGDRVAQARPLLIRLRVNLSVNDFEAAADDLKAGLSICVESNDKISIAEFLNAAVCFAVEERRYVSASQVWGASIAYLKAIHMKLTEYDRLWVEPLIDRARQELGDEAFEAAAAAGHRLSLAEVVELALTRS